MKKFLAIYIGTPAGFERARWNELDAAGQAARRRSGMEAWRDWAVANSSVIRDHGTPLGKTKSASPDGIADIKNTMVGYVILEADSHEAAARLFDNHPHFTIFPGDSVEIMECLPMPSL
ncbi:MAG: hypothetical protein U1E56_06925 [Bauldia sp.]